MIEAYLALPEVRFLATYWWQLLLTVAIALGLAWALQRRKS